MDSIDITMHHKEVSLLKRIGRGSYGVGHEAIWRNNSDRAEVSVKISLQDFEIDHLREIRNLTKFKHANIVALNGIYRKESIGLIFEYSGCGSLYDYLHKKVAEVAFIEKLDWMLQCANGMEYLHIRKIVHRELKTQNLLLFDDFRILKICDFNTAKQFVTSNTEIDETVCYMAPEVCDDNGKYTEKCDVFSFGVIFWEVLSEKKPFDIYKDLHPLAVQKKIINGDRLNINYIRIHHNSDLITPIIEKCWDGDPENRPTMKELASFIGIDCKVYIPINFKDIEIRRIVTKSRYGIVCNAFWRSGFFVRRATLKIIPPNKQREIIILREIYKLRDLNHRNIVTLYGVSKDLDNRICIIYEGEDCGSLYHLLHYTEENFDIWLKIEWIQQCAQGLAYLHSKNILHRNLNLDNLIIFNKYRLLKICNLGKASEITISNPDFNRIVCYVAPEVWVGRKK
ncbi:putative mitogen-activated protein kinase kinase kinase 7-like isoform X2 [Drosophila sulfurigaster albostrigata]|uniref:putative mitogen-activated protein kinase kinase kinase 7-like isoform X2 n=1 Tax=Drosophila sulfurigaster albostrigata TaxID=89887 RepID=UPI002D21C712|nr:putative mitogen-activated protein kinase kinase kinase 7-like isoform X2 [Drosophila sulfurigaster albostrigata]